MQFKEGMIILSFYRWCRGWNQRKLTKIIIIISKLLDIAANNLKNKKTLNCGHVLCFSFDNIF